MKPRIPAIRLQAIASAVPAFRRFPAFGVRGRIRADLGVFVRGWVPSPLGENAASTPSAPHGPSRAPPRKEQPKPRGLHSPGAQAEDRRRRSAPGHETVLRPRGRVAQRRVAANAPARSSSVPAHRADRPLTLPSHAPTTSGRRSHRPSRGWASRVTCSLHAPATARLRPTRPQVAEYKKAPRAFREAFFLVFVQAELGPREACPTSGVGAPRGMHHERGWGPGSHAPRAGLGPRESWNKSHFPDSNWRPTVYETVALPTELKRRIRARYLAPWLQTSSVSFGVLHFSRC